MPVLFSRQQFVISQVVVMEREEHAMKRERNYRARKMAMGCGSLNALYHPPAGRFPSEFSALCGMGFSPHTDPGLCGSTSSADLELSGLEL